MGELCISLSEVKPVFKPAVKAMDKNGDGKVCQSEVPEKNKEEFGAFVNKIKVDPLVKIEGKEILKSQLDCLQKLAPMMDLKLKEVLENITVEKGYVKTFRLTLFMSGLSITKVYDISPLQNLTNLKELDLSIINVSDISPLQKLANLESFSLHKKISDISSLQNLTTLKKLDLGYTNVSDISPLQNLTNLKELNLSYTKVSDISSLQNLTNLKELNLSYTKVSDVSPLQKLTNLKKLDLRGTKVSEEQIKSLRKKIPKLEAF